MSLQALGGDFGFKVAATSIVPVLITAVDDASVKNLYSYPAADANVVLENNTIQYFNTTLIGRYARPISDFITGKWQPFQGTSLFAQINEVE